MAKKKRLKVKRTISTKKKGKLGFWEYIIFGVGGVAAVVVAIWGGYYFSSQTSDENLSPAVQTAINHIELAREKSDFGEAERILELALKKHKDNEMLYQQRALLDIDQGKLAEAEAVIAEHLRAVDLRRSSLIYLREAYRVKNDLEHIAKISKEIAHLE